MYDTYRKFTKPVVSPTHQAQLRPLSLEAGEESLWAVATARLSLERRQERRHEHLYRHLNLLRDGRDPLQPFPPNKMGLDCSTCHQIYGPLLPAGQAEAKLMP
ncbi:ATP-dependent helicase/nuclease subunit A [Frankliniella fusca]|uniref:ATP-dependent helicase/nuclease subunit A n=1 Tax=Frankliniella fusca TaxID=407009 RepID=A0AAE1LE54_9NEOP|nr:ATP-dependent helicase/nuclease subunit A [Frankliniella fusca]